LPMRAVGLRPGWQCGGRRRQIKTRRIGNPPRQ
jgi:hypothetical protein